MKNTQILFELVFPSIFVAFRHFSAGFGLTAPFTFSIIPGDWNLFRVGMRTSDGWDLTFAAFRFWIVWNPLGGQTLVDALRPYQFWAYLSRFRATPADTSPALQLVFSQSEIVRKWAEHWNIVHWHGISGQSQDFLKKVVWSSVLISK